LVGAHGELLRRVRRRNGVVSLGLAQPLAKLMELVGRNPTHAKAAEIAEALLSRGARNPYSTSVCGN
jgi:hypothetical protein